MPRPGASRMVAAHSVEGDVVVAIGHRQRQSICGTAGFDDHPADPRVRQLIAIGATQQHLLDGAGAYTLTGYRSTADRQVTGRQHVGSDPSRQRVEYRRIACPFEAPHAVHGKDGDRARVGIDHRSGRRPSRRILHRGHLAAHSPRQIGQRGDQCRAADQCRRRRRKSLPQCDDRGSACERVTGNRQRHPFLAIAQHTEAGQRANRRLQRCQTGTRRHRRGHHHRDRSKTQQWHGRRTANRHRQPQNHDAEQDHRRDDREKRCPRGWYGVTVPDPTETGQAPERPQAGLSPRRERLDPLGL